MSESAKESRGGGEDGMSLASGIAAFEAKHFAQAAALLGPLAGRGSPQAQYRMAIMAQNGLGMVVDAAAALRWMTAAAERGYALAQHGLGFMYLEGECTEADGERAAYWFRRAAEQGLAGSQTTLGMMYQEGRGVARDPKEARRWLRMAGIEAD